MRRVDDAAPGARRRALMRAALGKPGSFGRWAVGSVMGLLVALAVVVLTGNVVVLFFAAIAIAGMFAYRSNMVGDEDELNAGFARQVVDAVRNPASPEPDEGYRSDPAEWFNRRPNTFLDVPLPPSAEPFDDAAAVDFDPRFDEER